MNIESPSQEAISKLTAQDVALDASKLREPHLQTCFAENVKTDDNIDLIRQFQLMTFLGLTPKTNLLVGVATCFKKYIDSEGKMSLDEAFGLKPKRKTGHPLKDRLKKESNGRLFYMMWCTRAQTRKDGHVLSIEDAAGAVIDALNLKIDSETLKKYYCNSGAENIFNDVKTMIELDQDTPFIRLSKKQLAKIEWQIKELKI